MGFLKEVEKKLDLPPGEKAEVLRELKSHYEEIRAELIESGMDAELAAREASRKLGDPADVAARLQVIHCRATWKTALMTAFPVFLVLLLSVMRYPLAQMYGSHASKNAALAYHQVILGIGALLGLVFLSAGIREIMKGRRPMWIATWLAVGYRELTRSMSLYQSLREWISGHHLPQASVRPLFAVAMLLIGIAAMAIFRRSTKWFLVLGGWTILIEAVYLLVSWESLGVGWTVAFSIVAGAPLELAIALGLFALHPYGSVSQASLFLFAFTAGTSMVLHVRTEWQILVFNNLPHVMIVASVLAYARASTWRLKTLILAGGIIAMWLAHFPFSSAYDTLHTLFMLFLVILVPMLFERRWSDRRPEVVR